MLVPLDMPVHDRDGTAQSDAVRGLHDFEPLAGLDLVGADHRADLVVEDLGRGARQGAQARRLQLAQEVGDRAVRVLAPCQISSGEKAWMWISGTASLIARQIAR